MTIKQFQGDPYEQYTRKVSSAESGGKATAQNPFGAAGLFQFVPSTWRALNEKYKLGYSQDDRLDPEKSKKVMKLFTEENKKQLSKRLGRQPDDYELYLAHGFGAGGAGNFIQGLNKNPNTRTSEFFSPIILKQNKTLLFNKNGSPKTLAEVSNHFKAKMSLPASNYKNSEKSLPKEEIVPLSIEVNNKLTDLAFSKELPNFTGQSYTPDEEEADKDIQKLEEKEVEKQELPPLQNTQQEMAYEPAPVREDISQDYIDANQTYAEIEQFVQMQNGGIITNNPNDPRLKAYQDSLYAYQMGLQNKQKIPNSRTSPFEKQEFLDSEDKTIKEYQFYKNTGILPTQEYWGKFNSNGQAPYQYGYQKPNQTVQYQPLQQRDIQRPVNSIQYEGLEELPQEQLQADFNINTNYQPTTFNISEYNQRMNGMQGYGSGRKDTNADILKAERALDYQNAYNNYIERTYNNPQSRNNPKAQERYETLRNYLNINPNYQQGGEIPTTPLGLWQYPNQTVRVPTDGSITMSKVPYEVLGISEQTGERIRMLPNQKYFFKNTNSVIEIPQSK